MIDTKELRKVLARHGTSVINEDEVLELLDRLEAAEKSDTESLMMYRKARDERDELRAKIAEMECPPYGAIGKILTEVMDIAVSNGANSISMPDEYVEVAAWLCGMPTQNVPNVSENYFGMTLHDKIEAMENKL